MLCIKRSPAHSPSVKWRPFLTEIFIWECWKWCFRASRSQQFRCSPSILGLRPRLTAMRSKIPMRYCPKVGHSEKACIFCYLCGKKITMAINSSINIYKYSIFLMKYIFDEMIYLINDILMKYNSSSDCPPRACACACISWWRLLTFLALSYQP